MHYNVTLQLGSVGIDAPVLHCTYKVQLASLIQLLNQSKKADGTFQHLLPLHF